ncbi:hypothetical protein IF188_08390 [Microbacterium sp. NEAU-LLC]|uniref:Uncharacterized protein n=1 Tax=Microbacterium helvum TaxID=2773713 RepID=A0ABR8NM14_9MICO|nr:hypothetical protein [Microbacterium helvum]MBD3941710.1 hypothetical protein [Microbacterium helvum]
MGLFQKLPEEPTEWAGLPSEPDRPESAAERLAAAAPVDIGSLGLGGSDFGAVESIVLPAAPALEVAEDQEHGEEE